ncbi:M48 family metallopeptidase [Moraxella sp. Tifton1]|uniref:M48 family metallopeptidase n=1 Tax=Moraxella oculi TaxID=2940516 RepID=UPI002012CBA2|nr:YgjP-like metallopeptidase domain-containing protein [Moraxella sp. Tifton1]MCL1623267.1 M48 family metallopeptidase [Moraxella sp. Tifton1]
MRIIELQQAFAAHGLNLTITKKQIKNINIRVRPSECFVSVPSYMQEQDVIKVVFGRLAWTMRANERLHHRQINRRQCMTTLWGEVMDLPEDAEGVEAIYRQHLKKKIPKLMAKWQPIVGEYADEVRLRKMTTRWGSCNTHQRRIWLSTYLAGYPYECAEYVFVHELCHLIHANHGVHFWAEVERAMPDYKRWHDLLKGVKTKACD